MALKSCNFARRIGATKAADGRHVGDKVWKAMRMLRHFTAADVVAVVESTNTANVARYARQLSVAGFLRKQYGSRGGKAISYQLVRDSGPIAPSVVRRRAALYDHNTSIEYALKGTGDAK